MLRFKYEHSEPKLELEERNIVEGAVRISFQIRSAWGVEKHGHERKESGDVARVSSVFISDGYTPNVKCR